MKRSALLTCCMCACLTTMMDSSSEFQHLAFAPGVTVEGQFLASLAPPRESVCTCRASSAHAASDKRSARQHTLGDASEEQWGATTQKLENVHERFWRVLVRSFSFPRSIDRIAFVCFCPRTMHDICCDARRVLSLPPRCGERKHRSHASELLRAAMTCVDEILSPYSCTTTTNTL